MKPRSFVLKNLMDYAEKKPLRMHMPGHKGKYNLFSDLGLLSQGLFEVDLTEVGGMDDLHNPQSFYKEAQDALSCLHGASKTYMLVNGSTSGITAALLGCLSEGDTLLIDSNAHQSVYRAIKWGRFNFHRIGCRMIDHFEIILPPSLKSVKQALSLHPEVKAILLTNPTYYGISTNLAEIAQVCHDHGVIFIVDEAHGAHWDYADFGYPKSAMKSGADISIQSYHKTLPALTQTAVLHLSSRLDSQTVEHIEDALHFLITSSPSYILTSSIDIARNLMEERGKEELERIRIRSKHLQSELSHLSLGLLNPSDLPLGYSLDPSRLTIRIDEDTHAFIQQLESKSVFPEMCFGKNVLFILTVADCNEDLDFLAKAIKSSANYVSLSQKEKTLALKYDFTTQQELTLFESSLMRKEIYLLKDAVGCICGEQVTPYPPGIPLLVPGELVTKEKYEYLQELIDKGHTVYAKHLPTSLEVISEL